MKKWTLLSIELLPITGFSLLPLFFDLSYQINLYMIWEGAYRLYLGEIPFKDFGIPMGAGSWIIPALFFKIFGPSLYTLAKAQAFMNIISGVAFRWILVNNGASFYTRFLSILIFSLTFILGLYWPQYNHTVIIFQLIALGFLFQYLNTPQQKLSLLLLGASAFFITLAFFTKQDAGALGLFIALAVMAVHNYQSRTVKPGIFFGLAVIVFFLLFILPFLQYEFSYWFNYGQPPHFSRLSVYDLIRINMEESRWEKFYLLVITILLFSQWRKGSITRVEFSFGVLVVGILVQAMIYQVTSYVPKDNNIFFHAFCCAFILFQLQKESWYQSPFTFTVFTILIALWWSEKYWKYADRFIAKALVTQVDNDVVSINTYILQPPECNLYADLSTWKESSLHSFKHIRMPASTVSGIDRVIKLVQEVRTLKEPIVLNMSELTPLAVEANYRLEKGPLWYHLGVGMFDRELRHFTSRISDHYYDLVIFEHIPTLNNFYPFAIREKLKEEYQLIDTFEAPRIVYPGTIEVYSRNK